MGITVLTSSAWHVNHLLDGKSKDLKADLRMMRLTELIEKLTNTSKSCSVDALIKASPLPKKETKALLSKMEKLGYLKVK